MVRVYTVDDGSTMCLRSSVCTVVSHCGKLRFLSLLHKPLTVPLYCVLRDHLPSDGRKVIRSELLLPSTPLDLE